MLQRIAQKRHLASETAAAALVEPQPAAIRHIAQKRHSETSSVYHRLVYLQSKIFCQETLIEIRNLQKRIFLIGKYQRVVHVADNGGHFQILLQIAVGVGKVVVGKYWLVRLPMGSPQPGREA